MDFVSIDFENKTITIDGETQPIFMVEDDFDLDALRALVGLAPIDTTEDDYWTEQERLSQLRQERSTPSVFG